MCDETNQHDREDHAFDGVVFEDLTYEGEKEFAIMTAAMRRGQRIQWPQIINLLRAAIEELENDSQKAIDNLLQQFSALREEAESSVIEDVSRRFIPLTEKQRDRLICELKGSLKSEKARIIMAIKYHEVEEAKKGTGRESWLKYIKRSYEESVNKW